MDYGNPLVVEMGDLKQLVERFDVIATPPFAVKYRWVIGAVSVFTVTCSTSEIPSHTLPNSRVLNSSSTF